MTKRKSTSERTDDILKEYHARRRKLFDSLPDNHWSFGSCMTNGMTDDLCRYDVLHTAMMELLSSQFTIKMDGTGSGMFTAKRGVFELMFRHGNIEGKEKSPFKIVCHVWMKNNLVGRFNAHKLSFYNFSVDKGRLLYDEDVLASYSVRGKNTSYSTKEVYQRISKGQIEKLGGVVKEGGS